MPSPAISFLLCTRNRAETARECVRHLLTSPRQDFEVVVRDNCSSDNTVALLRTIDDPRLTIHTAPNNQGTISFHEISKLARGEIVTWLSDEDDFQFEHLDFILTQFRTDTHCDVMLGSVVVGPKGRMVRYGDGKVADPIQASMIVFGFSGCGGLFVRRRALARANHINVEDLDQAYALWNFYPVGFFATRCMKATVTTSSRVVVIQARFARTNNNWSKADVGGVTRVPHYYPEAVLDRLASNLVNLYFTPRAIVVKLRIATRLLQTFRATSSWYASAELEQLLREHYPDETVQAFIKHVRALRLDTPIGRFVWRNTSVLAVPAKFARTLLKWRALGATTVASST